MAKLSEKYEAMVCFSLKNGEEQVAALNSKFTELIKEGAELINVNEWGKRRLAYPINYENDGFYVIYAFDCKPDFPAELERVMNITEGILRFLILVRNDAPVKPASKKNGEETVPEKAPEEAAEKVETVEKAEPAEAEKEETPNETESPVSESENTPEE